MMRGIIVVITALFSVVFLKRKQYAHHWVALALIVAGVAIVGWVSVRASEKNADDGAQVTTSVFGVCLLLLS